METRISRYNISHLNQLSHNNIAATDRQTYSCDFAAMAANMQHMGGHGQMMPQQQQQQPPRNAAQGQLQSYLYNSLKNSPPPINGITWHNSITLQDRLMKSMQL